MIKARFQIKTQAFIGAIFFIIGFILKPSIGFADDEQTTLNFSQPIKLISLAPHITEMIYSAGGGENLVGVVEYSNYPDDALSKPIIGNYYGINVEKIIQLQPDIILAWQGGNRTQDIETLKRLGFKIVFSHPKTLSDISREINKIARLIGTEQQAKTTIKSIHNELAAIKSDYSAKPTVNVFYQIWNRPLMTINGQQFFSQALNLCGAKNSFADLPLLASEVNKESILKRDPDVILLGGDKSAQQDWLQEWQKIKHLKAVKTQNIYPVNADWYQRPTERFVMKIRALCETIDLARD